MTNESLTEKCVELLYESGYSTLEVMVGFYKISSDTWGAYYVGWDDFSKDGLHLHDIHGDQVVPFGVGANQRSALEDLYNKMVLFAAAE